VFLIWNHYLRIPILKLKIKNLGSRCFCELEMAKKNCKFGLIWGNKYVENFNFKIFQYCNIVCVQLTNLQTFLYNFKRQFFSLVWKSGGSISRSGSLRPNNYGSGQIRTNGQNITIIFKKINLKANKTTEKTNTTHSLKAIRLNF